MILQNLSLDILPRQLPQEIILRSAAWHSKRANVGSCKALSGAGIFEAIKTHGGCWLQGSPPASASVLEASASPPGLDWSEDEERPAVVLFEGQHILELVGIKTTDKDTELLAYLMDFQMFAIKPNLV